MSLKSVAVVFCGCFKFLNKISYQSILNLNTVKFNIAEFLAGKGSGLQTQVEAVSLVLFVCLFVFYI